MRIIQFYFAAEMRDDEILIVMLWFFQRYYEQDGIHLKAQQQAALSCCLQLAINKVARLWCSSILLNTRDACTTTCRQSRKTVSLIRKQSLRANCHLCSRWDCFHSEYAVCWVIKVTFKKLSKQECRSSRKQNHHRIALRHQHKRCN